MRAARVSAATVVLGACLNIGPALGEEVQLASPPRRGDSPRVQGHVERPDDALLPAPERPSAPRAARSIYVRGPYTSVQVNVDAGGANILGDAANEPSIAVDPNDPDKMVIGWRQFDNVASNFRQAGWAYTQDGGTTWTFPGVLDPGQFRSDPVLDYDAEGNFYYNSLSSSGSAFWCTVFKSADGGVTWDSGTFAQGGDKQWMAIDRTGGIGHGNIYAAWNLFYSACTGDFTVSYDGGQYFEDCASMPGSPIWGTLAVGPDGTLFISGTGMELVRSSTIQDSDLPPAFDFATTVDLDGTLAFSGGPNPDGLLGQCWIAVDHSGGPTHGNLYMLASVQRFSSPDPLDVMFARSTDAGVTWSDPVRVNDDPEDNDAYQWFGTMSIAPNGRIDAVWNDTRNYFVNYRSEVYYSYSADGGLTWATNVPVSPSFNPSLGYPDQEKLGDYYDMISYDDEVHLAYAATFTGEQDVYYVRIFPDCNENGVLDATDISEGTSLDCGGNGMPDECEPDCNNNGVADSCDLFLGTSEDCNGNVRPDECEPDFDCNGNGIQDVCDVAGGTSGDCDGDEVPDECELDCDNDGVPDSCAPPSGLVDVFRNDSDRIGAWAGPKGAPVAQDVHLDGPIALKRFEVTFRDMLTASPATMAVRFYQNDADDMLLPEFPAGLLAEFARDGQISFYPGPQAWSQTLLEPIAIPADVWFEVDFDLLPGHTDWGRGRYAVCLLGAPPTVGSTHGLVYDRENQTTTTGTYLEFTLRGIPCADCNGNGLHDACDLACNETGGACDLPGCGLSQDCDDNRVPDECDPDADGDAVPDACDACPNEPALTEPDEPGGEVSCADGVDNDCDGSTDAADTDCQTTACPYTCGDIDGSGNTVRLQDFATFAICFGRTGPAQECTATDFACSDLNGSGKVDLNDFATFATLFGAISSNMVPNCVD